ncbi:MAG: hypothetical protein RI580_07085 [Halothece sp. Uz-M2-17]|nr:hypothetical protein [Halothece sp. Uz-M2-17]
MSPSDENDFSLKISSPRRHSQLIAGLQDWFQLGLLSNTKITLTIRGKIDSPDFLSGLEILLERDLIDDITVKKLATKSLTCQLPEVLSVSPQPSPSPKPLSPPNPLQQLWHSLQAEFSVQWLLFLGVFMVIASSGVLVGSQWENFSPLGQYSVLFAYTLVFWGISIWVSRQGNLPLTARTLRLIPYLLLPLNFWALNEFNLNFFVSFFMAIGLTLIGFKLNSYFQQFPLLLTAYFALNYIHLAWSLSPLVLIYCSIAIVMGVLIYAPLEFQFSFPLIIYTWGVIFGRALFVAGIPFSQLSLGIGGIGLVIFWKRLLRHWQKVYFLAILGLGLFSISSVWFLIPYSFQTQLLAGINRLFDQPFYSLFSLFLFPYIIVIIAFSDWLHQQEKEELGFLGDAIALIGALFLVTISLIDPSLQTITLFNTSISLGVMTQRRKSLLPSPNFLTLKNLVNFTHFTALATLASGLNWLFPQLSLLIWGELMIALMVIEWGLMLITQKRNQFLIFRESAWYFGWGLAGLSYAFFWWNSSSLVLVWLVTPITLTLLATQSKNKQQLAKFSSANLLIAQLLMIKITLILGIVIPLLVSFTIAGGVMSVNTLYLKNTPSALITVGFYLGLAGVILQLISLPVSSWLISGGIILGFLWSFYYFFQHQETTWQKIYTKAVDYWGILLAGVLLLFLTWHSFQVYSNLAAFSSRILIAEGIVFSAITLRYFASYSVVALYALAWNLEIILAEIVGLIDADLINLAIVNLVLGIIFQQLGNWRQKTKNISLSCHWHLIPLLYGGFGTALRWETFSRGTGLLTLLLAIILLGIGRQRKQLKPLSYLALVGISVSAYETLFYQFSVFYEGAIGNRLILISALGITIIYSYRLLFKPLKTYLNFSTQELNRFTDSHWLISSLALLPASLVSPDNMLGLGTGILLVQYAIKQGRNVSSRLWQEIWIYAAFILGAGMYLYWVNIPLVPFLKESFVTWKGAIISAIAYFLYVLPWSNWGWLNRPWQNISLLLPISVILANPLNQNVLNYLFVGAFYLLPTLLKKQIRYSYLTIIILLLFSIRLGWEFGIVTPLGYAIAFGGSLLYVAQFDPMFRHQNNRSLRHFWRTIGAGMICLVAFLSDLETGLIAGGITLIITLMGLAMKVRAFLYMGTITFLLNATYQLGFLIFQYPFSKWIIGLFVGMGLIWLAATFETRRENIRTLMEHWLAKFNTWE